jgi:hypothetical protein
MLPQLDAQLTALFAVNCRVCPGGVVAIEGDIDRGEVMLALAVAICPLPSVAVTEQEVAMKGAVKRPVLETLPQEVDHFAAALAVNFCVAFSVTVTCVGEMLSANRHGSKGKLKKITSMPL